MSSMYGIQPQTEMSHIHGVCDPHMNSLSLQEMIDSDIKADFDDVMTSNQLGFTNVDSLDLLNNLDDLDTPFKFDSRYHGVDEVLNHPPQWNQQPSSQDITALNSTYFDDSLSNNVMVNPNSVMPVHQQFQQQQRPPSHTPSPVPPQGGPQQPHLTVNTQINTYSQHHNLQHPTPSPNNQVNPMSPHPHPTYPSHMTTGGQIHYQYHPAQTNGQVNMVGKTLKVLPPVSSPMQQVPSPGPLTPNSLAAAHRKKPPGIHKEATLPKPAYSYSCLIALALKNSTTGSMSVSEIYKFMCEHFPYFKTAPSGWKNSVRHNLSLNKCFEKIEKPSTNGTNQRKGCLWAMNQEKIQKMDEEVKKWSRKDPQAIKKAMVYPETLEALERGGMVKDYNSNSTNLDSEDEEDPRTPASVSSQGSQGYGSTESDFVDMDGFQTMQTQDTSSLPELNLVGQAIVGAEADSTVTNIFDNLGDDALDDIDMEPLDPSDLINLNTLTSLSGSTVTIVTKPMNISNIRSPVTILSNMSSNKPVTISPRTSNLGLTTIKPTPNEKLSFITIKNPLEKNKIFIS